MKAIIGLIALIAIIVPSLVLAEEEAPVDPPPVAPAAPPPVTIHAAQPSEPIAAPQPVPMAAPVATPQSHAQMCSERDLRVEARLQEREQARADAKRLRRYIGPPVGVTFGGAGAGALMFMFMSIASIEGEWIPGLAWASYGVVLTSLTFGPSIGRYMAGLTAQGIGFTAGRLTLSGISLTMALLARNTAYNTPVLIFSSILSGAGALALAIADIATTRKAILKREKKTGVQVAVAPLVAPSDDGNTLFGLSLTGRF